MSGAVAERISSPGVSTLEEVIGSLPKEGKEAGRWVRVFTNGSVHPFDEIEWKVVNARIVNPKGETVFEQKGVEVPSWWEQTTVNIVADKYFRIVDGKREHSVKQILSRVVKKLRKWADEQGYFNSDKDARVFEDELVYALLHQFGAFNSPVWFNLGVPGRRQAASACFISGVDDTVESIMEFQQSEATIFCGGSGSGANMSRIRSSYERLSSGAFVCGPVGWMEGFDKYAKSFKSGGSTRNAAKMVVLDMDHPDILSTQDGRPGFITCKAVEEKRAHDLIDAGYGSAYDDPNSAYKWVSYQNANHSVSIPDEFMRAVEEGRTWDTRERLTGKTVHEYDAGELWTELAKAAWFCGDPGVQFSDTINKWHTTPQSGRIRSSNPCFAAETRIATESGLIPIADLYERVLDQDVKVLVHLGNRVELRSAVVFPTGVNPILEVRFRSGRSLAVTPNHNFLLRDGSRKPVADLVAGDLVDIQCSEGSFGEYDCGLPDQGEWYRIAGFVVGDGWMTKFKVDSKQHWDKGWKSVFDRCEVGMCFGKNDKDALETVQSFLRSKEIPYSLKRQRGSVGESPDYLRIYRKPIFEALEVIACPAGSRAHTKRIQPGVFEASKINQFAFLAGLFSADGTFRLAKKGNGGNLPTRELRLSSVSLGLLQDVQALLLNLGIKSNIVVSRISASQRRAKFEYVSASGETRTYASERDTHELFVYGHSLRKLRDGMSEAGGMLSARKQFMLNEHLPAGHGDSIHDIWHDEVVEVVDSGREELTYNLTEPETHTVIAEGVRIPQCSEFLHVDNTACNLCAINLTKFFDGRKFLADRFEQSVRLFVTAQNAIVDKAEYPTAAIAEGSRSLRPIGLNYGNLGSLLMRLGYGYDSDEGRAVAAQLASLMTGQAYLASAKLAARTSPFPEFEKNKRDMLGIMRMHQEADTGILSRWGLDRDPLDGEVLGLTAKTWNDVISLGEKFGYSVSQATLQAPLGTVSFLMGMDTTGIEPAFSLVTYKSLVGGGKMKLVNGTVHDALTNLGYSSEDIAEICRYIEDNGHIEGSPGFLYDHLQVFDCAMASGPSKRYLSPLAHLRMMAAIQPLITCAISKTVNLPESATVEEIADLYMEGWKLGLKCIALYRDGCKRSQPLSVRDKDKERPSKAERRHMPEDCNGRRHRFEIDGHKGYIVMNEYEDGTLGEVFLKFGKNGSTMGGLIDGFTQLLSVALQYGVPLDKLVRSFIHTKFEPSGFTRNPKVRFADSLYDYLFKVLDVRYFGGVNSGLDARMANADADVKSEPPPCSAGLSIRPSMSTDGPPCGICGNITRRNGACYLCESCGQTTGCS